jgi:hypothetical protein
MQMIDVDGVAPFSVDYVKAAPAALDFLGSQGCSMRRPHFPFAKLISPSPIAQKAKLIDLAQAHIAET